MLPAVLAIGFLSITRLCCVPTNEHWMMPSSQLASTVYLVFGNTVKPFNLAARKVYNLACKIILAPFMFAN